jgi:diguanylate cyclase (GGDEF)-like protein/PAS domain S-box-containing protein
MHPRRSETRAIAEKAASGLDAFLNKEVHKRLVGLLPGLVLFSMIYAVYDFIEAPRGLSVLLGCTSLSGAVIYSLAWYYCHKGWFATQLANAFAAVIVAVALFNSLTHLYLLSDVQQVVPLILLLAAVGFIFRSHKWVILLTSFILVSSLGVGLLVFSIKSVLPLSVVLVAAALLTSVGHRLQLRRWEERYSNLLKEEQCRLKVDEQEERYKQALQGAMDGLWYWDLKADKVHFSQQWASMVGFTESELGTTPAEWLHRIHPYYVAEFKQRLSAHLYGKTPRFLSEYRIRHRDGNFIWVLTRGLAERDENGDAISIAGSQTDITHLMDVEKRLLSDAFHDKLTGLPNRQFLMGRLETAVERKRQDPKALFGLMFLDLDGFKVVNDSLGHLVGDQLLAAVAARLRSAQRSSDIVARFGGDEFVILLELLRDPEEASRIAKRVRDLISSPFKISGHEVVCGTSIGIAFLDDHTRTSEELLRNADTAMYYAKSQRKGHVQIFSNEMHTDAKRNCDLQNDLGQAIRRDELFLDYQPVISLQSGGIVGVEALMRWQRGFREVLNPMDFIPYAERSGLIVEMGEWALRTACFQAASWGHLTSIPPRLAVNLSARQLQQKEFPKLVLSILDETGLDPTNLELELTETALIDSLDIAPAVLDRLSRSGIQIAIDDFGTGYSSLNYLRRFNFHSLKIDRSFISNVVRDQKTAAVTEGLFALAQSLNLKVTAEGVETREQLAFLLSRPCDQFQGYLASRPVPAKAIYDLLEGGYNLGHSLRLTPTQQSDVVAELSKALKCRAKPGIARLSVESSGSRVTHSTTPSFV